MDVRVDWSKQGRVYWEQHWLDEFGPVRSRVPDLKDHLSFVNYDLGLNGRPQIVEGPDGLLWVNIPQLEAALVRMANSAEPSEERITYRTLSRSNGQSNTAKSA
jgi:hypothetical protein